MIKSLQVTGRIVTVISLKTNNTTTNKKHSVILKTVQPVYGPVAGSQRASPHPLFNGHSLFPPQVNEQSTVAVAETSDNERFLVFDLTLQQHAYSIEGEDLKQSYLVLSEAAITADGHLLVFTGDVDLKDDLTGEEENESIMLVYDLEKGKSPFFVNTKKTECSLWMWLVC